MLHYTFCVALIYSFRITAKSLPSDCTTKTFGRAIELLEISTLTGSDIFEVYCELNDLDDEAWMVIFLRKQVKYEYGRWEDYEKGYNTRSGNYFIGLQRLHAITERKRYELVVHLTNNSGVQHFSHYDSFTIGNKSSNYSVSLMSRYFGSVRDEVLSDWAPWHTGPIEIIPRMKIAIRGTKHMKVRREYRNPQFKALKV